MNKYRNLGNLTIDKLMAEYYALIIFALAILISLILIFRNYNAVFYPILLNEDGALMLAYYWNNPHLVEVFRFYNGYTSLFPNLIGYILTSWLPMEIVAYAMVTIALILSTIMLSIFSLRRYRFIMPNDKARITICLIITLIPLGNHAIMTNLTFSLWHLFIIALFLILAPIPNSNILRLAQIIFLALAVWSHPLSIIFIPICFVLLLARSALPSKIMNVAVIILTISYIFFGVESTTVDYRNSAEAFFIAIKYIIHRVIFEAVFGNDLRMTLQQSGQILIINLVALSIVGILGFMVILLIRTRKFKLLLPSIFLACIILGLTWIAVITRSMTPESHIVSPWAQRYFYVQQLLFLFLILLHIVQLINWKKLLKGQQIVLTAVTLCHLFYLNISNTKFFETSKEQGLETMSFIWLAADKIKNNTDVNGAPQYMILDRGGMYDIQINIKRSK